MMKKQILTVLTALSLVTICPESKAVQGGKKTRTTRRRASPEQSYTQSFSKTLEFVKDHAGLVALPVLLYTAYQLSNAQNAIQTMGTDLGTLGGSAQKYKDEIQASIQDSKTELGKLAPTLAKNNQIVELNKKVAQNDQVTALEGKVNELTKQLEDQTPIIKAFAQYGICPLVNVLDPNTEEWQDKIKICASDICPKDGTPKERAKADAALLAAMERSSGLPTTKDGENFIKTDIEGYRKSLEKIETLDKEKAELEKQKLNKNKAPIYQQIQELYGVNGSSKLNGTAFNSKEMFTEAKGFLDENVTTNLTGKVNPLLLDDVFNQTLNALPADKKTAAQHNPSDWKDIILNYSKELLIDALKLQEQENLKKNPVDEAMKIATKGCKYSPVDEAV